MSRAIIFIFCCFLPFCSLYTEEQFAPERTVSVAVSKRWSGEYEFAKRMQIAGKRLNWNVEIVDILSEQTSKRYDWTFTLMPGKKEPERCSDYLVLFLPEIHFFKRGGHLKEQYLSYAGYLAIYDDTTLLLEDLQGDSARIYPNRWYPTAQSRPYQQVVPNRLFHLLPSWGERQKGQKYVMLQKLLSEEKYAHFFGGSALGRRYFPAYQGPVPFDGESLLDLIAEMGVCLVMHSPLHINQALPSGRIFEAAAASAVIISDLNPFVVEHFGDSVLYFDQNLSGEEMFEQIDGHMRWIEAEPEKALEMAKRAHQIFEERFTLEEQLRAFEQYHDQLNFK